MLKTIIRNELEKRLGRESTPAEQYDAWLSVSDMISENDTLSDLMGIMNDYIADNYVRCDKCGEMHRREETSYISGSYTSYCVCNNPDCEQEAYYDANNDPHREWATY